MEWNAGKCAGTGLNTNSRHTIRLNSRFVGGKQYQIVPRTIIGILYTLSDEAFFKKKSIILQKWYVLLTKTVPNVYVIEFSSLADFKPLLGFTKYKKLKTMIFKMVLNRIQFHFQSKNQVHNLRFNSYFF